MEALEEFSIEYDISDRERVYDYVTCTEYERPETGWDYSIFQGSRSGLDSLADDDENGQFRVKLMDKAFCDSRVFEKHNKLDKLDDKEAIAARKGARGDSSSWLQNYECKQRKGLPLRTIPIYKAGDVVKGKVLLTLSKPIEAEKLTVKFQGRSFVLVRCYHAKGYYDATGDEKFVKEKKNLWERSNDSSAVEDEVELLNLAGGTSEVTRSRVIHPGKHTFPFEFTIPSPSPQSTPPVVISSVNQGHITYRIKVVIDQEKLGGRGNLIVHRGIWVRKEVDIARDPHNMEPIDAEETLETGLIKSGKINVRVTMKRAGCIIGQPIPITVEVHNDSKGVITGVSAYIRVFGKARQRDARVTASNTIDIKGGKCKEKNIPSGGSPVFNWDLPWDFSNSSVDGNLLPVGDLDDSKLMDVKYEVRVDVKRKGLHRDMHLNIPLFVGNHNSNE